MAIENGVRLTVEAVLDTRKLLESIKKLENQKLKLFSHACANQEFIVGISYLAFSLLGLFNFIFVALLQLDIFFLLRTFYSILLRYFG